MITVREVKNVDFSEAWIAERLEVAVEVVRAALAEDRAVLFVDGMDEARGTSGTAYRRDCPIC